jgi:hypothetical protein
LKDDLTIENINPTRCNVDGYRARYFYDFVDVLVIQLGRYSKVALGNVKVFNILTRRHVDDGLVCSGWTNLIDCVLDREPWVEL